MRRTGVALVAVLVAGALAGILLAGHRLDAAGSSVSRGATGWMAARAYVARRGTPVSLLERPLDGDDGAAAAPHGTPARPRPARRAPGTLVLVFPWQAPGVEPPLEAVRAHLAAGGDLLVAYSGDAAPSAMEVEVLGDLGAAPDSLPRASLAPWRWQGEAGVEWRLAPGAGWRRAAAATRAATGSAPAVGPGPAVGPAPSVLRLRRPRWVPELPRDGALLVGPQHRVVAGWFPMLRGRVVVVPAELLCNARLATPANADLLESLRRFLAGPWRFDELHHGLVAAGEPVPAATGRGLDLVLLQLVLLYVVAAFALGRRLGPAWREAPPIVGSAASFLRRLGALHDRLGHHRAGAELLLRRAAELDRRFVAGDALRATAARGTPEALVAVGQAVARAQRSRA